MYTLVLLEDINEYYNSFLTAFSSSPIVAMVTYTHEATNGVGALSILITIVCVINALVDV